MQTMQAANQTSEGDIWIRLIQPRNGSLSRAAARGILSINFSAADKLRMQELADRNSEGRLSPPEKEELENYVKVGDVLSLLHLKARRSLQG